MHRRPAVVTVLVGLLAVSGCTAASPAPRPGAAHPSPAATVLDTGARPGARGTAVQLPAGHQGADRTYPRLRYTVVPGDTLIDIETRFRVCSSEVTSPFTAVDAYHLHPGAVLEVGRIDDRPFTSACV